MPRYEIKPGPPNTPLWDVTRDGVKLQEFTSRTAAQAYVDHVRKLEKREQGK